MYSIKPIGREYIYNILDFNNPPGKEIYEYFLIMYNILEDKDRSFLIRKTKHINNMNREKNMSTLFVGYPRCSTSRKAEKWMKDHGFAYDFRDISIENPTEKELRAWKKTSGLPLKRFYNTSGQLYRSMGLKDRIPQMTEEEQYALLASNGLLVKRPILVCDKGVLVGFKVQEWEDMLLS